MVQLTATQIQVLRRFAVDEAAFTRQGRRWLHLIQAHQEEIIQSYAISSALRRHVDRASGEAARLIESLSTHQPGVIDAALTDPLVAALHEVDTRASEGLRSAIAEIRAGLERLQGRTILQALGPRDV